MKIALFSTGIFPYITGGMQKHSYYLAKYLAQNKVYVDLYHFVPHDKPLVNILEEFSKDELKYIKNFCFQAKKPAKYPAHYIVEFYQLSKRYYETFLENSNVDFVYAQGFSGWYYAKEKTKGEKLAPIGVNFHGLEMFQKAPSFRVKLEHLMFRCPVKRVITLSDYTFSLGGKLTHILAEITKNSEKIITVPIGISSSWLSNHIKENQDIKKFVFLGRYERRKGIEELSLVLRQLVDKYDFEFHFIGPIPKDKKINSNNIIYHGLITEENEIQELLRDADILVTPSYSEGMPTVILEAMASGCAIIATDVGAVSEEVNGSNGWCIEAGNVELLKKVIIEALKISPIELNLKKTNSIAKIKEKFLWDDVVQQTINFMNKLKV